MKKRLDRAEVKRLSGEKWYDWHIKQYPAVVLLPDAQPDGLLSKAAAVAGGVRWYRTGSVLPCGHVSWQFVSNDKCRACGLVAAGAVR